MESYWKLRIDIRQEPRPTELQEVKFVYVSFHYPAGLTAGQSY